MNGRTHILIVEDSQHDRELMEREFFKRDDVDPWFVYTASEAIACIRNRHPDLVLLDLNMPAMHEDGLWVLSEMKRRRLTTPVAVMTGVDSGPMIEAANEYPLFLVIKKPLDQEKISHLLQAFWP